MKNSRQQLVLNTFKCTFIIFQAEKDVTASNAMNEVILQ